MTYELHPFCIPGHTDDEHELSSIVNSMRTYGYDHTHPIMLYQGKILDGAARQDAAEIAGVLPSVRDYQGDDDGARAYVIRENIARLQRKRGALDLWLAALVEARPGQQPGTPGHARKSKLDSNPTLISGREAAAKTRAIVAQESGRHVDNIDKARALLKYGAPNVIAMVAADEFSATTAMDVIRGKTKDEQAALNAEAIRRIRREKDPRMAQRAANPSPNDRMRDMLAHVNLSKLDIGTERIPGQPVQLWPARIQRLREAQIRLVQLASLVHALAQDDVTRFVADVALLQAYQPVPGKTNGEEVDYARKTQQPLSLIREHLAAAQERLNALAEVTTKTEEIQDLTAKS